MCENYTMSAFYRRTEIINLLKINPNTTANELANMFEVSKQTIYNDIKFLRTRYEIQTKKGVPFIYFIKEKEPIYIKYPNFYIRRLKILDILKTNNSTTSSELSLKLSCCKKTILRDISWLSLSYPIYSDRSGIHYLML